MLHKVFYSALRIIHSYLKMQSNAPTCNVFITEGRHDHSQLLLFKSCLKKKTTTKQMIIEFLLVQF